MKRTKMIFATILSIMIRIVELFTLHTLSKCQEIRVGFATIYQ